MSAEAITSVVLGILVTCLGFFLVRFINRSDKFQEDTGKQLSSLKMKVKEQGDSLAYQMKVIQKEVKESKLEPHVKADIKKLSVQLDLLQKQIDKEIRPNLSKPDENYGRILVLEKKLLTMFQSVEILVKKSSQGHQE